MIIEYIIGILALGLVAGVVYKSYKEDKVVKSTPKSSPKSSPKPSTEKLSKARLTALTKAQLVEKGKELGVKVNTREVKSKIVNQIHKAQ